MLLRTGPEVEETIDPAAFEACHTDEQIAHITAQGIPSSR
jgi:hypothetical protein